MHHLRLTSYAITALGIMLVAIAALTNLGAMWMLSGILLAWAGLVKIAVVLIWTKVARLGSDAYTPERSA